MNKFDKQGYVIVKGLVEKELATFLYNYSLMKRNILNVLLKTKYISPFEKIHGIYNDIQVPNTFSIYGDVAMTVKWKNILV
jgi:ribosomal protein S8